MLSSENKIGLSTSIALASTCRRCHAPPSRALVPPTKRLLMLLALYTWCKSIILLHEMCPWAGLKYLFWLFLFCLSFAGKKEKKKKKKRKNRKKTPNPSNSLKASKLSSCKCPKKLMSGLCLPKTWHPAPSPAMLSAAPLPAPWGGAGSGIRRVLSALFWKKRNYKPCTHKCFEETKVLAGRIASLTKALR